jgi:hypothetical protein
MKVIAKETNSLYGINLKSQFSHIVYTRGSPDGRDGWSSRDTWANSSYFLYVVLGSIYKTFSSLQHIL